MKVLFSHAVGGDGGQVDADLDQGNLNVKLSYPVAKIVAPLMAPIDALRVKLEALVPAVAGAWADPAIDAAFEGVKAEIVKLLSE